MSPSPSTLTATLTQRLTALRDQTLRVVDALRDLQQVQAQFWNEGSGSAAERPRSNGVQTPRG